MNEVDKYLSKLSLQDKRVLEALRQQILQIEPRLEERLSRGVPFFYFQDKRAFGYRSSKNHLSFFIMEGNVLNVMKAELAGYDNSSTVVRFTAEDPLPQGLVKKLVLARISEIEKSVRKH
jgi:uncharacterized protein YdhG (YjbR/CyaY superfamily)